MEFEGEFVVEATPADAWPYFTDTDILQDCAPGCKEIVLESPSRARATLEVGVGSVKPSFDVDAVVTEYDRPNRLELEAKGEASRNSFALTAWQELTDNGDGTTTVHWGASAEISGVIASLGQRAMGSVTDKLVNEFFENVHDHIEDGTPAEARLTEAEAVDEEFEMPAESGSLADLFPAISGDGEGPDHTVRSLSIGALAGAVAVILWNRFRRGRGGVGYLLVGIAVGVVAKVVWDEYTHEPLTRSHEPDVPSDEPEDVDAGEARDEATEEEVTTPDAGTPEADGEGMIDDPLDRLS